MASLDELKGRLSQLQDGLEELRGLIEKLAWPTRDNLDGEEDDNDDDIADEAATADLAAEITDGLREIQDAYEILQEDAADLPSLGPSSTAAASSAATTTTDSHDRARFQEGLARLGRELPSHHAAFRKARLQARQALEAARRAERRDLLAAYAHPEESDEEETDEDDDRGPRRRHPLHRHTSPSAPPVSKTTAAAADVTAALRQTQARLAGEIARSDFAAQTLAESSRALAELGDRYDGKGSSSQNIGSSLEAARGLVRGLVAAHKSDTWYLQTALYLLAATAAWLLFRRLLYGPLWLLVWWPVRTAWGAAVWAGGSGSGSGSKRASSALSVSASTNILTNVAAGMATAVPTVSPSAGADTGTGTDTDSGSSGDNNNQDTLVDQVGRIIDGEDAGEQQDNPGNGTPQNNANAPNPMKRMWEEDKEAAKYEEQQRQKKDEL